MQSGIDDIQPKIAISTENPPLNYPVKNITVGTLWLNTVSKNLYVLLRIKDHQCVWKVVGPKTFAGPAAPENESTLGGSLAARTFPSINATVGEYKIFANQSGRAGSWYPIYVTTYDNNFKIGMGETEPDAADSNNGDLFMRNNSKEPYEDIMFLYSSDGTNIVKRYIGTSPVI